MEAVTLHSNPGIVVFLFSIVSGIYFSALKSRPLFEPKFFRDFNAKADLSHVAASMPIRSLGAQALENSGILVQQMMSNNRIPGIECSPTLARPRARATYRSRAACTHRRYSRTSGTVRPSVVRSGTPALPLQPPREAVCSAQSAVQATESAASRCLDLPRTAPRTPA